MSHARSLALLLVTVLGACAESEPSPIAEQHKGDVQLWESLDWSSVTQGEEQLWGSLDGRFVIMLDCHMEQDTNMDQPRPYWPIVRIAESIEDALAMRIWDTVICMAPKSLFERTERATCTLAHNITRELSSGHVYLLRKK